MAPGIFLRFFTSNEASDATKISEFSEDPVEAMTSESKGALVSLKALEIREQNFLPKWSL